MKVYRISKWAFGGICILIVLLPISRHWELITTGKRTTGNVTAFVYRMVDDVAGERYPVQASEIEFSANGEVHKTYGPVNYEYKMGRSVRVFYDPDDPAVNCVATFSGFYLNYYSVIPLVLLVVWYAFYLSFNNYRKKMKMPKYTSSSPKDQPVRKAIHSSRKLPFLLFLLFLFLTNSFLPDGGLLMGKTTRLEPNMDQDRITELLNRALPGDTMLFGEGVFGGSYTLIELNGKPDLPIVIRGISRELTIIDGGAEPGMSLDHQAFSLKDCSWIVIEEFSIRNCWTDLIRAENSSYISLRKSNLKGGKRALFATGRQSHHFLVESCKWEQDERVWTQTGDYSWEEIHHGKHRHYNGSLFQGSGISGVFVLRDNHIKNTFNAFRLSQINEGEFDPLACTNGEIYRNTIINTSDNVLEPEVHTRNLHYYHNTMINGHAFISITEVQGGEIYIYGNTAVSLPSSDDGWTVFKISCREDSLSHPLYIYNNSWQVDFDIIGSPRNQWENSYIRHFNNASVQEASDTFGIYHLGADNHFDYDCSNVPFPGLLTSAGLEKRGQVADPMFLDPYAGDFRLKDGSPCINKGKRAPDLILDHKGRRPDMGAYNKGELIEGMPFRYVLPQVRVPYKELPRITRIKIDGRNLKIWFSLPMDAFSLKAARKILRYGGRQYPLTYNKLSADGYCLTLRGEDLPEPDPGLRDMELLLSDWPMDLQGQKLNSWASEIPVSLDYDTP